jgi:hypothetical protein
MMDIQGMSLQPEDIKFGKKKHVYACFMRLNIYVKKYVLYYVTERCGQILDKSSRYQQKKMSISTCVRKRLISEL